MENKSLLPLQKRSEKYKIVIPIEVERKIRFLCNHIWDVEWSGILFYQHSGSFEKGDLVVTCKDILPMDIGTTGYTEFFMSPDVATYYVAHPELLECKTGLVHSHGQLSTFFSGTDQSTLQEEGTEKDNFVSLIVNNAGVYTAGITRKVSYKATKHVVFKDLNGNEVTFNEEVDDKEEIEWFNLDIEKATDTSSDMNELNDRISTIKKAKEEEKKKSPTFGYSDIVPSGKTSYGDYWSNYNKSFEGFKKEDKDIDQPKLFNSDGSAKDYSTDKFESTIDTKKQVDRIVRQLLTGCVLVSDKIKYTNEEFVKGMEILYDKRFNKSIENFELWATTFIDFLLFEDGTLDNMEDPTIILHDVVEKLSSYKSNKYLDKYIECLSNYVY